MADSNPAPAAPNMAGVAQNTGDQQAQILGAIAKYGQAGMDAYTQAQNNVQGYRQNILNGLANTQGIGGDAAALLRSQANAATAPALSELQTGQANLQGDLARSNQMYTNYANEANAAVPVIQGNTQNLMTIRDAALQQAQQQLDAQKAADAAKAQNDLRIQQLQLAQQQEQTKQEALRTQAAQAKSGPSAADTQKGVLGTIQAIQANAGPTGGNSAALNSLTDISNDVLMNAEDNAAYNEPDDPNGPVKELAKIVGGQAGMSIDQIYSMLTPTELKNLTGDTAPTGAVKALTDQNLPGLDAPTAQAILNSAGYAKAQNDLPVILKAPLTKGLITGGPYNGMTPTQAATKYINSLTSLGTNPNVPGSVPTPDLSPAALAALKASLLKTYGITK